ncbi:MAG TPA: cysteine desulfurase family protein [Spirochaetales bacterium]|nr:cysteine desulfurase family protein [Spirochaetales bacterium]HQK34583.1 cysteine desulfurase family protein [Spirochaetales bacterium]
MIYADNAATTRISDSVFEKMLPFLREQYGNASSQYSLGVKAKRAVEHARRQVAVAIGANASEITFTSGGSEANNWVIRSVAETYRGKPMHIITSEIEHHSVLNACRALEQTDIEVTYLPVNATGVVEVTSLKEVIRPHTKLVSIMLANNEIGTVQPVEEIGQLLKSKGILFHTDAVQAVGHVPVNVSRLGVDFLTASAHKFNGAKGTGILYKRSGIDLSPLVFGGKQEYGLRAGTENVAGIVSAGYAIEESISLMADEAKRLRKMVEDTVDGIKEKIPSVRVNGDSIYRLPGTVNLGFDGVSGEALMNLLDLKGICVSTSSACTSGKDEPSHVLLALGLSEQQAKSAIRISYGRYNTSDEVGKVISAVYDAYSKILGTR